MANNDGLLTNDERNTYSKLIESIDNSGLTNETITVEAEVTANTEKLDNQFVSLNKAIDNTLDTLDRGVNQHKGAFDIWNTFGVELDSSAFGKEDANKDRAEKDAIYDQLSLLAKALNKDPKLLGILTSLNKKHLKIVVGEEGETGYLDQAIKVIGFENGVIDKRGYKKKDEYHDVAGFVRLGNSVIAATKRDKYRPDDLNSTLFHEYGHLILQKFLNDIGVEYENEMTVVEMIDKLKSHLKYREKRKIEDYDILVNTLIDKQLSGKITQQEYDKEYAKLDEVYNKPIEKTQALINVFENINTSSSDKYAKNDVKHHEYINDAHEVFARSFKNYISGISNITGGKRVNNNWNDILYTHEINNERLKTFSALFNLMNGENIAESQDILIKKMGEHKLKNGITSGEIIKMIDNINQNTELSSTLLQLTYIKKMLKEKNIDVTKFNYSPSDVEYIMNAWSFDTDAENEHYKNILYDFFSGDSQEKLDKFKELETLGKTITELRSNNATDKINNLKKISETLRKIGYDNLSKIDIDVLLEAYNSLDPESKEEFKNLESSLKGALGRIPSGNSDEKIRAEFSDKVKEQCVGFNNFETCIKSLADTFKTQFESAIDNSANAFKLAFESAITSYGDVLARVGSCKNPFTADTITGGYKQEMIMAEHSSGNNKKVTFEEIVKEINQYVTPENIEKQLKGLEKSNFQRFIKNMNDAVSTGDEKKKQSVMDSYQKDYVQNALTIFKSSVADEQTPVVPSGFDKNAYISQVDELMDTFIANSTDRKLGKEFDNRYDNIQNLLNSATGSDFEAAVAEANKFLEDLKSAVANAKPISETVKDTVKETVNSADTVKKTEEIINETVNNTKKSIESGTGDSGKGENNKKPPKEPSGYNGKYFIYEKFANTGRDKEYGVGADEFNIKGTDQDKNDIVAKLSPKDTKAIIKPDQSGVWKINLGDEKDPNSLATLKAIMELNETATHILKHMSDFYKFQFNNPTNPEVTPMEWQNINYRFRSERIHDKLFGTAQNPNLGYFSQNYRIGKELRSYDDLLKNDPVLKELQGLFNANQKSIAEANNDDTRINPMETLKLLEKQAELKAQMVFRTKELIKAERDEFREQEKQRRQNEKAQKRELTRNEVLDKLKGSLDNFNDKNVHDANNNIVNMRKYGNVTELQNIIKMFNTAETLLDASDEEFKQAVKGIVEAINSYKESARRIKMSESDTAKEAKRQEKEIEKMTRDSKKEIKSGIKQADKMLAGDSTYKSIFGKYKIPELSRSGKFSLTDTEKTEVERIKNALKTKEYWLSVTKTKANQEYLRGEIDKLNAELDNYITGTIAERAKEIAKLEDNYKQKVIPSMEKFNHNIGHIFNTNADIDYERVRQGGFGKLKELSKFIDLDTMFNKVFNFANLKKSLSGFVSSVKGMFSSGVKMLESAFSKIYGIVSSLIKNITIAITGAVATVTAAVTGFVAGFATMGKSIVGATDVYRKQTIALSGVYKSPVKTNQMINSVYDITRGMPVNYTQAIQTLSEMSAIPVLQNILKSNDSQKSDQLLTKMFKVITAMTTMRPDQNASGAIFSLRNAFAGDLRSLQRRFDLPVANIMNSKGTMGLASVKTDPMAMLDSLENYFDTFLDVETINKVSDTISSIIEKIKGAIDLFKANIGNSGFYDLVARDFRKIRNIVLDFVTSDSGKSFAKRLSDVFSNVYNSIKNMAVKIKDIFSQIFDVKFDSLPEMFTSTLEFFAKSVKYVDNLLDVKTVVDYVQKLLESVEELKKTVAPMIDTIKKKITEVIKTVLNFSITVLEVIGDVVGALKKTGLNDKGLFYLWLFGPGNVVSLIGNGLGAITSGITASVISVGLLAKGFGSVAALIGISSVKLALIVGSVTVIAGAIVELIHSGKELFNIFEKILENIILKIDKLLINSDWTPDFIKKSIARKYSITEELDLNPNSKSGQDILAEFRNQSKDVGIFNKVSANDQYRLIRNNLDMIEYANGAYQVSKNATSYDYGWLGNDNNKYSPTNRAVSLHEFVNFLNEKYSTKNPEFLSKQIDNKYALNMLEIGRNQSETLTGKALISISKTWNGIGSGIDWIKSFFTGDSKGLEGAQTASKTAEQTLKDFNKQLESYKNEKGEFDYERFNNDIKAGLVKLTGIKDGIDKIHLDRIGPDQISLNYDKELRSISMDIEKIAYQRTGAFATRFNVDESNKIFNTKHGKFGAGGIEELNLKRLESMQSIYRIAKSYSETPDMNVYKSMFTIPIAGLSALNKTISINNMIYDTAVKSVDLIRDSLAKKSTTYTPTDIVNYIIAKRKDMENELFEELSNSMKLQYSVYFSTNDELSHYLNDMERKYKGDLNQMMTDISSGNVDMKNLSDMGKSVLTELAERYNAEREYYNNLVSQRMYIEAQNKNIGKMGLGAIKQNWTSLMNSPYKKVRDAAGSRYTDIMNEGLERDDVGSMVRKIRDIAINSFTDMKNAVINAVQETVKSTQQTIKNGLDRLISEGGTIKNTFKEIFETIKKNFFGIYTNEASNQITEFIYGSSFKTEKENPMADIENSIVELNKNTTNEITTFQNENNTNFLKLITKLDKFEEILTRIENKNPETINGELVKGSAYIVEKQGSNLAPLDSKYADFNTISNGVATRRATDIGKDHNKYDEFINEASRLYDIDSSLIKAVINTESTFKMLKANKAGAIGLMQVTGGAAHDVNEKFGTHYDINNPRDNILAGTAYLRMQMNKFKNTNLALAAYNAGAKTVIDAKGIPNNKETQNYIPTVNMFKDVFDNKNTTSKTVEKPISSIDNNIEEIKNEITNVTNGDISNITRTGYSEINAPTINNIISGTSEGFNFNGLFDGINIPSGIADLGNRAGFGVIGNAISKASGLSVLKSLFSTGSKSNSSKLLNLVFNKDKGYFDSINLTDAGSNVLNEAINAAGAGFSGATMGINVAKLMNQAGSQLRKPETQLKGIWGDLFGTVENVESKFGGASVGSFLGNMMSGKGIWDSFASANTIGASTFESLKGANSFTKVATGLTSTLLGKSAGSSVAKALTGTKIFGTSLGTALPVVGAVAYGISKLTKTKDKTAEGRARGAEFDSLRNSLVANRSTVAKNYYMANDDTLDALQNYVFGNVRVDIEHKGGWKRHLKGTARNIAHTDASALVNSMQAYWDLLQQADEENRATQRSLNKLQNTNNMEYLRQTGAYEEKRRNNIQEELSKYRNEINKYAGRDAGFTQTLFDGQSYTMTQLNDKIQDLINKLGDSKDAIAQNTEAIRQEKLATESAKLDYQTALYGDLDPTIAPKNNLQKLQNEWNSIVTETPIIQEYERITGKTWDGSKSIETIKEVIGTVQSVGYTPETKEYWDYMTRLTQANRELKNVQKQQSIDLSTNWISDLRGIAMENGTYDNTQIKQLSKLYGKRENLKVQIQNAVDNMDSALAEKLYDESQAITEEIEHYKSSTTFSNAINNAKENLNNIFGNVKENPITSLIDNTNSIVNVIKQSEQWIKDAGYSGYDELDSSVLLPLFNSSFGNVNEMANIFTEGISSGVFDTSEINPFKDYYNNWISTVESLKTNYRNAVDSGATEAELRILMAEYQTTLEYNMGGMNDEYKKMFKKYQQNNAATSILGSISGFEDYTVANDAFKEFTETLGSDAMEKLMGYSGNSFDSEALGKFMNVSGLNGDSDPYEMYYEWEKKRILQRIENYEEGSEEWQTAELELWNLMADNAKYLKEKAEKTTATIEEMLNKIEETARTRVAEEAKSAKGDIIFFDLGSSREGTQFINKMLDGIDANTPESQKLMKTLKQKLMGMRR